MADTPACRDRRTDTRPLPECRTRTWRHCLPALHRSARRGWGLAIVHAVEDGADHVGGRHARANVHEIHPHEISGFHADGFVVESSVEHRKSLIVLQCLRRVGSRNEPFRIARSVDGILHDDDLSRRPKLFRAGIDDHGSMNAALDVQVGHGAGGAVIHEHARSIDDPLHRQRLSWNDRTVMPRVDLERMGVETV